MIKRIYIILILAVFFATETTIAQENVGEQIKTIPANISKYVDGYLYDLTNYQGISYLNTMHTSGKVLGKWELNLSLNAGTAFLFPHDMDIDFSQNFELKGLPPSIFGSGTSDGELFFRIFDDEGKILFDPFSGEQIGFSIPFLPGLESNLAYSPSVMPVISLGIGFGTEISVGALPGAIKAASGSLFDDFKVTEDMLLSAGIRHDVFHWVPALAKRNVRLTVGATYNKMTLKATAGQGLFDAFENINSELIEATNNLTGVEYGFTSMGFEAMLSKKLSFIDLSLFASSNQSDYYIQSEGNIVVKTANNFYPNNPQGYETTTLENLVDIEGNNKVFVYGAAVQFNLGRLSLGAKYGISDKKGHYATASLGFRILKEKESSEM